MNEFTRNNVPVNLEGTTGEAVEIVLKFKDDYAETWERNSDNTLKFEQVKRLLISEQFLCFFQKYKKNEEKGEYSHKIIIPFAEEKAIELIVILSQTSIDRFTKLYSYFVIKAKETIFITEPIKETVKRKCKIRLFCLHLS